MTARTLSDSECVLRGCRAHGTTHCPATAPAVLTTLLHEEASRDGRNYLEDRPLCFVAILVTSAASFSLGSVLLLIEVKCFAFSTVSEPVPIHVNAFVAGSPEK